MENTTEKKQPQKNNIRKIALDLIESYEAGERYVNLLLSSRALDKLTPEENGFLTALLYTAVEKKLTFDYLISAFCARNIDKIDMKVRNILRLGLCQILCMDSIPDFAAVNETVKLASHKGERAFINGVLRRAVREKDNLPLPKREKNLLRYLSVIYSVPLPLVKFYAGIYGEAETEKLLAAFSVEKRLSLTVNTSRISVSELSLKLADLEPTPAPYTDNGIILGKKIPPQKIFGFSEGLFFVQDEASRLASEILSIEEGQTVVDVCAAPGGKTFAAAIKAGKTGKVFSFDIHSSKLSLIKSGAQRLGLTSVEAAQRDATNPDENLFGKADRVICDAVCSGLGVISKKPDLRYKDLSEIDALPPLQYSILEESAKYLKAGGLMVYSTCTLNPRENEEVTDKFIREHKNYEYMKFSVGKISSQEGRITLLPHIHGTDGFYIALIRKNKDD